MRSAAPEYKSCLFVSREKNYNARVVCVRIEEKKLRGRRRGLEMSETIPFLAPESSRVCLHPFFCTIPWTVRKSYKYVYSVIELGLQSQISPCLYRCASLVQTSQQNSCFGILSCILLRCHLPSLSSFPFIATRIDEPAGFPGC